MANVFKYIKNEKVIFYMMSRSGKREKLSGTIESQAVLESLDKDRPQYWIIMNKSTPKAKVLIWEDDIILSLGK